MAASCRHYAELAYHEYGDPARVTIPDHLRRHLAQSLAIMAITTATGSGTTLLIRIPGGLLYSPRRARPLLAGALVLGALAFALYPLMHEALLLALIGAI